jgi:4-amino-4-deoxy-L-arabinose transferase-like glycosyltransferase
VTRRVSTGLLVDSFAWATPLLLRVPASACIALAWALATLPNLSGRSFMWEEGSNAVMARDMLARGDWLEPAIFGLRWVEKPTLLPWLIAGAARVTDSVDEWSARLPAMLATLGTALFVERLTRRYASAAAALFAAGAFMFCPLVLRKLRISEPDTLITFLSFAAFVVWWNGEARGRVSVGRWLACGGLLAVMAMAKGPQPLGFFALGVGAYLVARRRWAALPRLALCLGLPAAATIAWAAAVYRDGDLAIWFGYLRLHDLRFNLPHYLRERARFAGGLPLDLLPNTLFVPALLAAWWRRGRGGAAPSPILLPLVCYASLCTLALLVWPGTKTRYAMPIVPAVAVMAGLAFEPLARRRQWLAAAALAGLALLFGYQMVLVTAVIPIYAEKFAAPRRRGPVLDAVIGAAPAPVFTLGKPQANKLFYLTHPIRSITLPDPALVAPAWMFAPRAQLGRIEALRPDLVVREVTPAVRGAGLVLARIERRPGTTPAP